MPPPDAYVSWSSGKDSAYALHEAERLGLARIVGVLTTISEAYDRVAMHGVRCALLDRQIAALDLPCIKVPLPSPCPNEVYETRMADACGRMKAQGVRHIVFGDLFLEDIRAYRVEKLAAAGMEPIFPLWNRDTSILAREMIASGLLAHIACLDPRKLPREFAGRPFDEALLRDLPAGVDPCGENGEFHTVVSADALSPHRGQDRRDGGARRLRVHGYRAALNRQLPRESPRAFPCCQSAALNLHPADRTRRGRWSAPRAGRSR